MDHHILSNDLFTVEVRALGAALNRVVAHTDDGDVDLVLGHAEDAARAEGEFYLGELVGPTANRIEGGRFTLDGTDHAMAVNDRGNTLHGGPNGFSTKTWDITEATDDRVTLALEWSDAPGGLPGVLTTTVTYTLDGAELTHVITVTTTEVTLASPCSHPYVNLAGSGTILDQVLTVRAGRVLFTDETGIPTGDPQDVTGTPFDLRGGVRLGDAMAADHPQVRAVDGLDHAFVLDAPGLDGEPVAELADPASGRSLAIWTDQPSLQVFTGAGLQRCTAGLHRPYPDHAGVALETQQFPNAANRPDYPSIRLEPGQSYTSTTRWRLSL